MNNADFFKNSFLFGTNAAYLEELYYSYLQDKNSVSKDWQLIFADLRENNVTDALKSIYTHNNFEKVTSQKVVTAASDNCLDLKVRMLAEAYRAKGHFLAKLDPLELEALPDARDIELGLENFGLTTADSTSSITFEGKSSSVDAILKQLQRAYCGNAGYEFAHITDKAQRKWLSDTIENYSNTHIQDQQDKKTTLQDLIEVESFEQFLQTKFPSAKRFSVEGADNSIISVLSMIKAAAQDDVSEVIIGMAHRGRLNALTKIMQKPYISMLSEFQGQMPFSKDYNLVGDVKYHEGYSTDISINNKRIHLSMMSNPSHLEAVNPVLAGKVRARQDVQNDAARHKVMGVLLHGDASFSGQGVVAESLMLSGLKGYDVGGILHIIVNNQVGFTATAKNGRTSRYPSEVGKIIEAPIFHVNGNSTEDVVKVSKIATWYRNKFKKDVVINLVCYRLYGHNEMDEPKFTQPTMYKKISMLNTPGKIYSEQLLAEKVIDESFYDAYKTKFKNKLEKDLDDSKAFTPGALNWFNGLWKGKSLFIEGKSKEQTTGVKTSKLKEIGLKLSVVPTGIDVNARIARQLDARKQMMETGRDINWATAEALAFGSLLLENVNVRLSGQDSGRGTFSQRHSVLVDQANDSTYMPLNHIAKEQAQYEVIDSSLSEYAVMGFEYGYSLVNPNHLVLWEGQYGDFANGAQIIIDQFIASAELKWRRSSGIVLLLPHAYEGEGPEHSSGRLERFLQLCGENNIQVVNCSTPASYFHVLRRQINRDYRKPLVVMSPKSLLRHKLAVSTLAEMDEGTEFSPIIIDKDIKNPQKIVLCTGKVYYDLLEYRQANNLNNVAIVRLEQLYPFPKKALEVEFAKYKGSKITWCQEEPENMGAWRFLQPQLAELLPNINIEYAGRKAYSSTSDGYSSTHKIQQEALIKQAISS